MSTLDTATSDGDIPPLVAEATGQSGGGTRQNMPGLEFVGAGYDAFGLWANAQSVRANLFDLDGEDATWRDQQLIDASLPTVRSNAEGAFTSLPTELKVIYRLPADLQYIPIFSATADISDGMDRSAAAQALSVKAGIGYEGELFSAELSAEYGQQVSRTTTTTYYTATLQSTYFSLSMGNLPNALRTYLRPSAKADLDSARIDPATLFQKYGTHYLNKVYIGCKLVYGHTVDSSALSSGTDVKADLKAAYMGVSASGGVAVTNSSEHEAVFGNTHLVAAGVSDVQMEALKDVDTNPFAVLREGWHTPSLVDFDSTSLVPIWTLCHDKQRAATIKAAFEASAKPSANTAPGPDLTPLYRLRSSYGEPAYKLWPSVDFTVAARFAQVSGEPDGSWTMVPASKNSPPALCVYTEKKDGTVALYAYRRTLPGAGPIMWRYEPAGWEDYMAVAHPEWSRGQTPVGFVYPMSGDLPTGVVADTVYCFSRKQKAAPNADFYLYSLDPMDSSDSGSWTPDKVLQSGGVPLPLVTIYCHEAASGADRYFYDAAVPNDYGWKAGSPAWRAATTPQPNTVPIYCHEAGSPDRYKYDQSPAGSSSYGAGRVAFYAYASQVADTVPIYSHQASDPERYFYDRSTTNDYGWGPGSVAFYAYPAEAGDAGHWRVPRFP